MLLCSCAELFGIVHFFKCQIRRRLSICSAQIKEIFTAECQTVSAADAANVVAASSLTVPQSLDTGNVCSNQDAGYIYVQNNCSTPITATLEVCCLSHHLDCMVLCVIGMGMCKLTSVSCCLERQDTSED